MKTKNLKTHKKTESLSVSMQEYIDFVEEVEVKMASAQLSLAEKKARFKGIKENGARLTKHRFTV